MQQLLHGFQERLISCKATCKQDMVYRPKEAPAVLVGIQLVATEAQRLA